MSSKYDDYLTNHIKNVEKGYNYILEKGLFKVLGIENLDGFEGWSITNHDKSKYSLEEYEAYDNWFYGNKSHDAKVKFEMAWLHHIHNNPHHWQYYLLREDDPKCVIIGPENGPGAVSHSENIGEDIEWINDFYAQVTMKCLEIPDNYILEMVCDWWSFSWKSGNLLEIFDWYDAHKNRITMHPKSIEKTERLMLALKESLGKDLTNYIQM